MATHKTVGEHIYDGMTFHKGFPASRLDQIKETVFDDLDLFVIAYPKCGTTWLQEILYLVHTDGDVDTSNKVPLNQRFCFIELGSADLDQFLSSPPPRLLKSHLSTDFLAKTLKEKKTKYFVILRNPKDMLVSYFHFYKMNTSYNFRDGSWDEFFQLFKDDRLVYGNYFTVQSSWWKLRNEPNVLVLKYEDMLVDLTGAIEKIAIHLGKTLTPELLGKIVHRTSFASMKNNPMLNHSNNPAMNHDVSPFMRKGKAGDWKNYFSKEQSQYVDQLCAKYFAPIGLHLSDGDN